MCKILYEKIFRRTKKTLCMYLVDTTFLLLKCSPVKDVFADRLIYVAAIKKVYIHYIYSFHFETPHSNIHLIQVRHNS